jgi:hypothetical protein
LLFPTTPEGTGFRSLHLGVGRASVFQLGSSNAVSLDDPREILSIGFVDIDAAILGSAVGNVAAKEAVRHSRIDEVIESTVLRSFFDLRTEHDLTGDPREIGLTSAESLLSSLHTQARGSGP